MLEEVVFGEAGDPALDLVRRAGCPKFQVRDRYQSLSGIAAEEPRFRGDFVKIARSSLEQHISI